MHRPTARRWGAPRDLRLPKVSSFLALAPITSQTGPDRRSPRSRNCQITAMPIPAPSASTVPAFPLLTASQTDATRTSSWSALPSLRRHVVPSVTLDLDELGERDEFMQVRLDLTAKRGHESGRSARAR